jgi:primosomal protein N' (replication factor Y) (superfamily II helicase)
MQQLDLHATYNSNVFATVLLPLALPKPFTYRVPLDFVEQLSFGMRVEVPFGKSKAYSAIVIDIHNNAPEQYEAKEIIAIIDKDAVITRRQLEFWQWLAAYYCCTIGEVMNAALPSGLKLDSETQIIPHQDFDGDPMQLTDKEYLVYEALTIQNELSIDQIQKILNIKTVRPIIYQLLEKKVVLIKAELKAKYKAKTVTCVRLQEPYRSDERKLSEVFAQIEKKAERQLEALMAFIQIARQKTEVLAQEIYTAAKVDSSVLKAMEKKGIFEVYKKETSRLVVYDDETGTIPALSDLQKTAVEKIKNHFEEKNVVLLHGVTGSGKTRVYVELMAEAIKRGEQILYLVPEIALTTQLISRLQKVFGDYIAVYHSKFSDNERVELWRSALLGKSIILGARSSLFLPFNNLKLIIVDEEHDASFKQAEPSPRYHARDAAIVLAQKSGAKVLLGTATPSIESYYNARHDKYGLVYMGDRFGGVKLPEIIFANVLKEKKDRKMQSHFSTTLLEQIKNVLANNEQVILFQNRRGYAPYMQCNTCGWKADCDNCDVSLTFHKGVNCLRCHYCGHYAAVPKVCGACGNNNLTIKGLGTEKVEDDARIYLPEANIGRMDTDTIKTKNAHAQLINDFEEKRLDIMVGTQMVTKGLDFDNVSLVGVINADSLLFFPDFRAGERAFQMLMQVSGRAGRRETQGKVVIQTSNPNHPVLIDVKNNDFLNFYKREIEERKDFLYPPFFRLIQITLRHKRPEVVNEAGKFFALLLKKHLGKRVIGPALPNIPRLRSYYLIDIMIKIERDQAKINFAKDLLLNSITDLKAQKGMSTVEIIIDVDPV